MSKRKQTFTDPQTGEEVESTRLARGGAGMIVSGLVCGLVYGLLGGVNGWLGGLLCGLAMGLAVGLFGGVFGGWIIGLEDVRRNRWTQRVHDGIARRQHFRRQRILSRQQAEEEWAGIPDGALSRTPRPSEPEPTASALSPAGKVEEPQSRLRESVEKGVKAEKRVPVDRT